MVCQALSNVISKKLRVPQISLLREVWNFPQPKPCAIRYSFSNPSALTSTSHFTLQPRVTRIPRRPIFTWHPHKARLTSYTCKETQLKTSGAKHRILILIHSWGTEKHTDGSNGNSSSALRWRRPQPLRNSVPVLMSRMAAEPQDKNFHCYIIIIYWKYSSPSLGNPGKVFGNMHLFYLESISMHSTEGWGSASLQRQHTVLHLAMVVHPFLAFEMCSFFETLLLQLLFAAAL